MRFVLAFTALALLPGVASAQCICACIQGRTVPVCAREALNPPICQQICTPPLAQRIWTPPLAGGGGAPSVDPQTQAELAQALAAAKGDNVPLGTNPALSGALQSQGVSGAVDQNLGNISGALR